MTEIIPLLSVFVAFKALCGAQVTTAHQNFIAIVFQNLASIVRSGVGMEASVQRISTNQLRHSEFSFAKNGVKFAFKISPVLNL